MWGIFANFMPMNPINYIKISKGKMQYVASLRQKKFRKEHGVFVAEGSKCVADTLGSFPLVLLVATTSWMERNLGCLSGVACGKVFTASPAEMERMSSLSTAPEVIAVYVSSETDLRQWREGIEGRLTLLLDGVQDPGNLGTIIRAADWFGVHHIAASKSTADLYNAKTIQATMGAISRVKMVYTDLEALVDGCEGIPVYGTLLEGENMYDAPLSECGFIIFGSEGHGISDGMRRRITQSLLIPSYPPGETTSESLNVAVATAITLAEFRRRTFNHNSDNHGKG